MKRSRSIRLVLIGGLSAGTLAGCGPSGNRTSSISASEVYTNNYYLPGVGYYHAPFRNWYPLPYNHYDPQSQRYFQGGQWAATPHASITNSSDPTPEAVQRAAGQRTAIQRSGFGSTARHHYIHS